MMPYNELLPEFNDGRFFVSPILGCTGACAYCYLDLKKFYRPRKNNCNVDKWKIIAQDSSDFNWGRNGTIISVGAWGDIFPQNNIEFLQYSVDTIKQLLSWGNPVQIMSKNKLDSKYIQDITKSIRYENQLLYSTTITSLEKWRSFESGTSNPIDRLETCREFHNNGISTNVLLKPFIPTIAAFEIEEIANLLLEYCIDYCTLGVMYWDEKIQENIQRNIFLREHIKKENICVENHLDCNGDNYVLSTSPLDLIPYVEYLRERGILAFLKSSCVNANILNVTNPSGYYQEGNPYCIKCGNCIK